jgi:hypothetical protein
VAPSKKEEKFPRKVIAISMDYKKKNMSTDRENGRGNKRVTESEARRKKALHCAQT